MKTGHRVDNSFTIITIFLQSSLLALEPYQQSDLDFVQRFLKIHGEVFEVEVFAKFCADFNM